MPILPPPSADAALVWFRRDLRDYDHAALYRALKSARRVYCAFVFDRPILDPLPRDDRRVEFIHGSVAELDAALRAQGGGLIVRHGDAATEIPRLAAALGAGAVFANRDYEPAAIARDARVAAELAESGIAFGATKDQVVFDGDEVLTQGGAPFSVFTPYKNAWLKRLAAPGGDFYLRPYPTEGAGFGILAAPPAELDSPLPSLADLGFAPTNLADLKVLPGMAGARARLADFLPRLARYKALRDFPGVKGVSYLSVHLRFGTLSIRELAGLAWRDGGEGAQAWLNELIWRDFYFMILARHPRVVGACFRPEYDALAWDEGPDAEERFAAWCAGRTGYPLVDAAQRQLNQTGYMHNRLRMVSASFLTKDLGIDWRRGEAYFAEQLIDFDLAANNGGWQWAASTGCDAQPYFRIFNPVTQSEKFDPEGHFIRRYVPELAAVPIKHLHAPWTMGPLVQEACGVKIGRDYPAPVVDHASAREATLARFAKVRGTEPDGQG
ncbi:cryptochrome/photolyase family protein [Oryzomicrobium sp.]|uniref:cryptochrome/photolyase family protein n=1 Tax=Oryzomicrobium sp. TaxID=1911578 RepID=UPI002FE1803C